MATIQEVSGKWKSDVLILLYHQVLLACLKDPAAHQHPHPDRKKTHFFYCNKDVPSSTTPVLIKSAVTFSPFLPCGPGSPIGPTLPGGPGKP